MINVTLSRLSTAILAAAGLAFAVSGALYAETSGKKETPAADNMITEKVDAAFSAARTGDLAPSSGLQTIGPALIPVIALYLKDDSEVVRRQTVVLLDLADSVDAAPHLASALDDPSEDITVRAADALYKMGGDAIGDPIVVNALGDFVTKKGSAAGPILLLGYTSEDESAATLNQVRNGRGAETGKVGHASPAAPVPLIADIALTRLGDDSAKSRVLVAIEGGDFDSLTFLLHVLRDIEDHDVLRTLADATLGDMQLAQGDVPSHADIETRLADLAAARFAGRFGLSTGSGDQAIRPLTDEELGAVREELAKRLSN